MGSDVAERSPRQAPRGPRVAIVHDWLTGMRGGEKVLEAICELYPDAPVFTLVRVPGSVSTQLESRRIRTSMLQRFPSAGRAYRQYLPFFPAIVECFDLDGFDLVISSSHCAAKSVIRAGRAVHVCYCHSPMRYAWDQFEAYFGPEQVGRLRHRILKPVLASLARWDRATADRVDRYVANSRYVAGRIRRYYNRESDVVYPPVDTAFYRPADRREPDPSFLVVSALVPYKKVELAIEACRRVGVPLKVVGRGPEMARLQRLAGPATEFLGWQSDEEVRGFYQRAAAVLLPGVEDFGMVPVEAQACGTPVVALGSGGANETVIDGQTGVLAAEATPDAFAAALTRARTIAFDQRFIREHALRFSRERFMSDFRRVVDDALQNRGSGLGARLVRRSLGEGGDSNEFATREADNAAARMPPGGNSATREAKP
jgi:glycosyltransferase involved in cell wall biosynthesis